jgi:tungstate transport system permease protein
MAPRVGRREGCRTVGEFSQALVTAIGLIGGLDADLAEIIFLSLRVSLSAVAIAALIGLPLGAVVALFHFPGRGVLAVALNTMMGLPPVVVGLGLYLLLSRSGPLGVLSLLFTPTAMIIAQAILVTPIVAALTRQTVADLWSEEGEQLRSLGAGPWRAVPILLWDGRFSLLTAVVAGFGRASAEVGAVMIVGGNIDHVTRVMTTTIALETSKGNLVLAMALGMVLLAISLSVNGLAFALADVARRQSA